MPRYARGHVGEVVEVQGKWPLADDKAQGDGVMLGTQLAARHMKDHGGGSIINTSSIAGWRPAEPF